MKSSFARPRTKDAKIIGGTANLDGSRLRFIETFMIQPYCRTSKTHAAREIDTNGIDSAEFHKQACRPEDRAKYRSDSSAYSRVGVPTQQRERT